MNLVNTFCLAKYYSTFDSTELLNRVQQQIDSNITSLSREFLFVFHRVLYTDPCYFWDKKVFCIIIHEFYQNDQNNFHPI